MKTINHPLFITLFSVYLLYYVVKQTPLELPLFITNYLADLLSLFIVNTIALWIIRKAKSLPNYELPWWMVLTSVLLFSFYFEWYLPKMSTTYIADKWDVLCYFLSGIGFFTWRKYYSK